MLIVILAAVLGIVAFSCLVSQDKQMQDHIKPDNRNNGFWIIGAIIIVIAVILFL